TRALSFGVFLFYSYAICLGYVKLERDRTQLINNTKKKKRPLEWRSLLKLISAVPGAGLEPARGCPHKILSLVHYGLIWFQMTPTAIFSGFMDPYCTTEFHKKPVFVRPMFDQNLVSLIKHFELWHRSKSFSGAERIKKVSIHLSYRLSKIERKPSIA